MLGGGGNEVDGPARKRVIETLARAYHQRYVEAHGGPAWERLDEDRRDANRASARRLFDHVAEWGLRVVTDDDASDPVVVTESMLEDAARREHDGWAAERRAAGWTLGPRDDTARTHPDLVPYDELDQTTRAKDRERIEIIPELLARVGRRISR